MANTQFQPVDVPRRSLGDVLGSYRRGAGEGFRSHYTPSGIRENYANNGAFRGTMTTAQDLTGGLGRLFHNLLSGGSNRNRIDRLEGVNSVGLDDWNSRAGNDISNTTASDAMNRLLGRGFTPDMFSGAGASSQGGMPGITSPWSGGGNFKPINLDYGQTVATDTSQGGLEGITSPNPYTTPATSHSAPNPGFGGQRGGSYAGATGLGGVSGGGARDAFAGTSGSSDWGNTFASLGMLAANGESGDRGDIGDSALRNRIRAMLSVNPQDARALNLREQLRESRAAGR